MGYEDFMGAVQTQMKERLGEGVQIWLHQIMKNNSVLLDALSISEEGSSVAPTIYLNDFYQAYREGTTLPELVDQMEELYRKSRPSASFDTSFYADFQKVKEHLACRLINRRKNEELLGRVPHRDFLDLAVVAYYCLEDSNLGSGTILVYESHRKNWGVSEEELMETARGNTLRILPERFMSMSGILKKYREYRGEDWEDGEGAQPMYVLTNSGNYFGAASLLFDSVLQKVAKELDDDFWVLPSSVHECIVVPASLPVAGEELQEMVREINRVEVAREDYLSDEVYFYQRDIHKLSM